MFGRSKTNSMGRMIMSKWTDYEIGKKKIAGEAKSAEEYERRIKELCMELGI